MSERNQTIGRCCDARLVVAVGALLCAAALGSAFASGSSAHHPAAHSVRLQKVVALVTSVSGERLYLKRHKGGGVVRLRLGDRVYLHDIVAIGPGTKATLKLSIPKGLSSNTDLLDLFKHFSKQRPKARDIFKEIGIINAFARTHRTLKLKRTGTFIEATLSK